MMRLLVISAAFGFPAFATDTGTSSTDLCYGDCTTTDDGIKTCKFTASIDIFASFMGYWTFAECGDTVQPMLAMEQNVEYTFDQSDETNWYHPLGFAYFADGAHKDVDELEPGITQSSDTCADSDDTPSCQAPMYYNSGSYLGGTYVGSASTAYTNDGDFGLDNYEPRFFDPKEDWLEQGTYEVKLTVTDTTYTGDLFYFCHIHNDMSGRIKVVDSEGALVSSTDTPALGYDYVIPSTYDASCGTYDVADYQAGSDMCDDTFICNATTTLDTYADCLSAMDCHMKANMKSYIHSSDPTVTFCHQMIPHHQNAINMAKVLMKQNALDDDDESDAEIQSMLWGIVNVQNYQINIMDNWLDAKGYAATDLCETDHDHDDHDGHDHDDSTTVLTSFAPRARKATGLLFQLMCAVAIATACFF